MGAAALPHHHRATSQPSHHIVPLLHHSTSRPSASQIRVPKILAIYSSIIKLGMAKTRSMTRSQNNDDMKRFKTCDNGGVSDLHHDVLFLVMMQLGFVDFLAFSAVCKSWRSLALLNRKKFIASRPPMLIKHLPDKNECYLEDFEGRKVKTFLPYSDDRKCAGLACGYLIFFGEKTHDFWLVNPITRDELYFPRLPYFKVCFEFFEEWLRVVLVFSPSRSRWVLVVTFRHSDKIRFSIDGKGAWNHVSSTLKILDLHVFKGKIYALTDDWQVCEMSLNPEPKLTLLEINDDLGPFFFYPKFVSAGENLYVIDATRSDRYTELRELDFGKMKWALPEEKKIGEYVFFLSFLINGVNFAAVKLESWAADLRSQYKIYDCNPGTAWNSRKGRFFAASNMWYFLHECMNAHFIDE